MSHRQPKCHYQVKALYLSLQMIRSLISDLKLPLLAHLNGQADEMGAVLKAIPGGTQEVMCHIE